MCVFCIYCAQRTCSRSIIKAACAITYHAVTATLSSVIPAFSSFSNKLNKITAGEVRCLLKFLQSVHLVCLKIGHFTWSAH